jgi:pyruvate ferredoxin oxidoreductase beta subunit
LVNVCDTLGRDIVVVNATGCMEITSTQYPVSAWRVPYIHSLFENAPAVASGVVTALRAKGNHHTTVVVIAGDGSTYDIGFGGLSGMLERNEDVLYICYDNELYANTGVQKSGATPFGAATTTTQVGKVHRGKESPRKRIVEIAASHNIPYAASASIAFLADLKIKLKKAQSMRGARFITVHAPCALGAGFDGSQSMHVARTAVQSRLWFLFQIENMKFKLDFNAVKAKPVSEYFSLQKRFAHLTPAEMEVIQATADQNYSDMVAWHGRDNPSVPNPVGSPALAPSPVPSSASSPSPGQPQP